MLLTIGMIVKNEEKYLDKCLTAIKPILDSVDSELIITDTGSTDLTVEIARKYTDMVLHFDWINDFSAARNFGLEKAHGEWFMYLDADDIFESCDEIIKFFNSGEYKWYNSASYIGKNIVDNEGFYALNNQPRLTKIHSDTRFKNVVHEVLTTYGTPKKSLRDIAVHYGYMYENEDAKKKKYVRNKELLLKRLEKEKDTSAFIYVQLCENEDNTLENDKLKYIDEGIVVAKKLNDISIIPLLIHKARLYMINFKYLEALEVCNDYFKLDDSIRPSVLTADMEILVVQAYCLYQNEKYNEAIEKYQMLFKLIERYKLGKLYTKDSDIILIEGASAHNYISHTSTYIKCLIKTEQYIKAYKFISETPFYKYISEFTLLDALIENEITVLENLNFENIFDYIKNLDKRGKEAFVTHLCRRLWWSDRPNSIIDAMRNLGNTLPECNVLVRLYDEISKDNLSENALVEHSYSVALEHHADFVMIAMNKGFDIFSFIGSDNEKIKKIVWDGYRHYYGFHSAAEKYDINSIKRNVSLSLAVKFYEYCMQCTDDFRSPKPGVFVTISSNRLLEKFGLIGQKIDTEGISITDDYLNASVIMGKAIDLRKHKAFRECISVLKSIVLIYEPIARYVSAYCNEVIAEYNDIMESRKTQENEMERLSFVIKNNIRGYIASGNINAAQKTLNDYQAIAPNDPEIDDLQKIIDGDQ